VKRWVRDHSLSIVALVLFALCMVGQALAGRAEFNQEQRDHHEEPISMGAYLTSGHFGEATFENWESEFLQMAVFIALTAFLVQKGSAESRKPPEEPDSEEQPEDERPEDHRRDPNAPWPVRAGGIYLAVYKRSLSLVLFILFAISFALHAVTGAVDYNQEARAHGGELLTTLQYLATSRFWFESLQNWQSEFLSVWAIAVFSIWLRQQGSPESKPVHAPYEQTGAD
jgi:hypothetical protein